LSESGEDQKLLTAIECAANPTRHKILEILSETPGLGTKALADKMGVTRQHIAYHIGELRKAELIKDMLAGTIVVYNNTQLGRTALQRIHSTPLPEKPPAQEIAPPIPSPQKARKQAGLRGAFSMRSLSLMPALAGFLVILLYSIYRAGTYKQPNNYILGGLMVATIAFLLLAYISKKVISWLHL